MCLITTQTKHNTKVIIKTIQQTNLKTKNVIMTKTVIKTKFQLEKEAKELSIYNEWNELMSRPGAMATAVDEHLMNKYNLHARSSIWQARQRTAKRIKEQELLKSESDGRN